MDVVSVEILKTAVQLGGVPTLLVMLVVAFRETNSQIKKVGTQIDSIDTTMQKLDRRLIRVETTLGHVQKEQDDARHRPNT